MWLLDFFTFATLIFIIFKFFKYIFIIPYFGIMTWSSSQTVFQLWSSQSLICFPKQAVAAAVYTKYCEWRTSHLSWGKLTKKVTISERKWSIGACDSRRVYGCRGRLITRFYSYPDQLGIPFVQVQRITADEARTGVAFSVRGTSGWQECDPLTTTFRRALLG